MGFEARGFAGGLDGAGNLSDSLAPPGYDRVIGLLYDRPQPTHYVHAWSAFLRRDSSRQVQVNHTPVKVGLVPGPFQYRL
jgi:hypothetical protein